MLCPAPRSHCVTNQPLVTAPHSNPYRPTMDPGELRRATMIEPKAVSSHPPDIAKVLEPFANSIGTAWSMAANGAVGDTLKQMMS